MVNSIAVLIVFHAANEKTEENKIKTRQKIKKGRSKRCCRRQSTWLIIAPLSHRYRYDVALLSLLCCTAIALLSFRCGSAVVAPLSRCYLTAITPVLLHCRSADVAPAVATQSHRYRTVIASLLLRCCRSCCCYAVSPAIASAVAPLSLRCRTAFAPLSISCRSAVVLLPLLSLCFRCCCSCCQNAVTAEIAQTVTHGRRLKRQNQGNGFHQ